MGLRWVGDGCMLRIEIELCVMQFGIGVDVIVCWFVICLSVDYQFVDDCSGDVFFFGSVIVEIFYNVFSVVYVFQIVQLDVEECVVQDVVDWIMM